jgi:hypothetical protein
MFEKLKSRLLENHFSGMRRGALWMWFKFHSKNAELTDREYYLLLIEVISLTQNTKNL